jgi:hypothetical protein
MNIERTAANSDGNIRLLDSGLIDALQNIVSTQFYKHDWCVFENNHRRFSSRV